MCTVWIPVGTSTGTAVPVVYRRVSVRTGTIPVQYDRGLTVDAPTSAERNVVEWRSGLYHSCLHVHRRMYIGRLSLLLAAG